MSFKSFETSYLDCVGHELSESVAKIAEILRFPNNNQKFHPKNKVNFLKEFPGTQEFQTYTTCLFMYEIKSLQVSSRLDNRSVP